MVHCTLRPGTLAYGFVCSLGTRCRLGQVTTNTTKQVYYSIQRYCYGSVTHP